MGDIGEEHRGIKLRNSFVLEIEFLCIKNEGSFLLKPKKSLPKKFCQKDLSPKKRQ